MPAIIRTAIGITIDAPGRVAANRPTVRGMPEATRIAAAPRPAAPTLRRFCLCGGGEKAPQRHERRRGVGMRLRLDAAQAQFVFRLAAVARSRDVHCDCTYVAPVVDLVLRAVPNEKDLD